MPLATIVGQAPNSTGDKDRPLMGSAYRRIGKPLGMSEFFYSRAFKRINLLAEFPGKNGKGHAFPRDEAKRSAGDVCRSASGVVVLLGKAVAEAFGVPQEYFRWSKLGECSVVCVPHPSGVNTWWNNQANRDRFAEFLDQLKDKIGLRTPERAALASRPRR